MLYLQKKRIKKRSSTSIFSNRTELLFSIKFRYVRYLHFLIVITATDAQELFICLFVCLLFWLFFWLSFSTLGSKGNTTSSSLFFLLKSFSFWFLFRRCMESQSSSYPTSSVKQHFAVRKKALILCDKLLQRISFFFFRNYRGAIDSRSISRNYAKVSLNKIIGNHRWKSLWNCKFSFQMIFWVNKFYRWLFSNLYDII